MSDLAVAPIQLEANTVPSFYPGAGRIGTFRHATDLTPTDPEDWIASTARRTGMGDRGLTTLPDGSTLANAIAADPRTWLGPARSRNSLLIKLLDAGARLPVHIHPTRAFANEHLGSEDGKTEAWLVLHAEPGASVHLGFSREVADAELEDWVVRQDTDALLASMNRITVAAGDVLLCPAGVPHAIGAGILVIELQEATDFSIMLEWAGFPLDPDDAFLGLERDLALGAVDRTRSTVAELAGAPIVPLSRAAAGVAALLPPAADPFFTAEQIVPGAATEILDARFAVLFVLEGSGVLTSDELGDLAVSAGQVWLLPYAAGTTQLRGAVSAVRCYPA